MPGIYARLEMEYRKTNFLLPDKVTGRHMVTVVAALEDGIIGIHDPLSKAPGFGITKRKMDIYKLDGTKVVNYRFQNDKETHVRFAFADSPLPRPRNQHKHL